MNSIKKVTTNHILFVCFFTACIICIYLNIGSPIAESIRKGERINILLIGSDLVDYARHSDTMILLSYEPTARFIDVLSIPRDTHVKIQGYRFRKINEVYTYHYRKSKDSDYASRKLCDTVEVLLSSGGINIDIPYYAEINFEAFARIIDLIGGVTIKIDSLMDYDDYHGNLHIHFEPGMHHLNGKNALEYVRYRGFSGDRGRIYRQQQFLKMVMKKFRNPMLVFKFPQLLKELAVRVNTNLKFWDLLNISMEIKELNTRNMRLFQLPGKPEHDLWEADTERSVRIVKLMKGEAKPLSYQVAQVKETGFKREEIKIEVFNASNYEGLAKDVTDLLRGDGFDVVSWGNYAVKQNRTIVVDRTGNVAPAQYIAELINSSEVISRIDLSRMVDVSLILGKNYKLKDQ
ncbi:MAG: LCP family protein [bacterium]